MTIPPTILVSKKYSNSGSFDGTNADFSSISIGYIPYKSAGGFVNSPIFSNSNAIGIGTTTIDTGCALNIAQANVSLKSIFESIASPIIAFKKARGTVGGATIVNSADRTGIVYFQGYDGTNYVTSAMIEARVDDTPGSGNIPGRLMFHTFETGGSLIERLRIKSTGEVLAYYSVGFLSNGTGLVPATGAGGRLMWVGAKYAFRAGYIDGTQWDEANIRNYSFGGNYCTIASGVASTSFGLYTKAQSYGSFAIGRYNVGGGTYDSWVSTDPLFEIGWGTGVGSENNIFTVDKNGHVFIGNTTVGISSNGIDMSFNSFQMFSVGIQALWCAPISSSSSYLILQKSRGSITSKSIVQSGDRLGHITFRGYDGAALIDSAVIQVLIDGTPNTNDMPGRIEFYTTPSGSNTPSLRMTIKESGWIGINETTPSSILAIGQGSFIATDVISASSSCSHIVIRRAKGSVGAMTSVADENTLGAFDFQGYDGSSWYIAGSISSQVEGTPSSCIIPNKLLFYTTNTSGISTERMCINNVGNTTLSAMLQCTNLGIGAIGVSNANINLAGTISSNSHAFGIYMGALTLAPASANEAYFNTAGGAVNTGGNTIPNAYSFYTTPITKSGGGTITNTYGLYITTSSSGTNNYGAFINGQVLLAGWLNFQGAQNITGTAGITINPAGVILINPTGANKVLNIKNDIYTKSEDYASQITGWSISGTGSADFRYVYADEMHVKAFIADLEQALTGSQIICKSVAKIATNFTAPSAGNTATLVVEAFAGMPSMKVFVAGDVVRIRQFTRTSGNELTIADCWGTVDAGTIDGGSPNPPTQTYTFTRSSGGDAGTMSGGTTINAGQLVLDYGVSGNGFYEVTATDGAAGINAPYAQTVVWTSHPNSGKIVTTRLGKITGITGQSGEFGLIAGSGGFTATDAYVRLSNIAVTLHNIPLEIYSSSYYRIGLYASGNVKFGTDISAAISTSFDFVASSGTLTVGFVGASKSNLIFDASTGILQLRNNTTARMQLNADGSGWVANNNISWTSAGVATIAGWVINATDITKIHETDKYLRLSVATGQESIYFYDNTPATAVSPIWVGLGKLFDGSSWTAEQGMGMVISTYTSGEYEKPFWLSETTKVIAGWNFDTYKLYKDDTTNSCGMASNDYPFYAGNTYANRATAPFRVTKAGAITATAGSIAGWTLNSSDITKIYDTDHYLKLDVTTGQQSIYFYDATPATNGLKWMGFGKLYDGTNWTAEEGFGLVTYNGSTYDKALWISASTSGIVITGGTIRTAASGKRVQMSSNQLTVYNADGDLCVTFDGGATGAKEMYIITNTQSNITFKPVFPYETNPPPVYFKNVPVQIWGAAYTTTYPFYISTTLSSVTAAFINGQSYISNSGVGVLTAFRGDSEGSGTSTSTGIYGYATSGTNGIARGVYGEAKYATSNYAGAFIAGTADSATYNIGIYASATNATYNYSFYGNGGEMLNLSTYSNNVGAVRTVMVNSTGLFGYNASSIRYKEKITDLEINSSLLYQLKPVSFNFKQCVNNPQRQFGLIAEEVNKILPCLVDYDKEGRPDYVAYERLPTLLLNELQKHEKAIQEIKQKLGLT